MRANQHHGFFVIAILITELKHYFFWLTKNIAGTWEYEQSLQKFQSKLQEVDR